MNAMRQLVMLSLPDRAVTRAGTLSAVLLRIVASRRQVKDATRITALTPAWRRAWRSMPLVLDDEHLLREGCEDYVPAVDHVVAAHPGPFRSVRLAYCFFGALNHNRELERWPRLLAARAVQDLIFISPPPPVDMPLPADILRCTELRRLYLGFWEFPDTRDLPNGAGVFLHLREFVIFSTRIKDGDLDHMLASSPALETLALVFSYGLPKHVRLRGQNLQCMLFWHSMADELSVVDTPRLERLIMSHTSAESMMVRIACAPQLRVLGFLDTGINQLQIGNTIIQANTEVSSSFTISSVKIAAFKVNFGVFTEVQMLASFLKCFPNVETLHVEFSMPDKPIGKNYGMFLAKLCPIECVHSCIKKVVLHEFRWDASEVVFLQYLTQRAYMLQKLTVVLSKEILLSVDDIKIVLKELAIPPWACDTCTVSLVGPNYTWNFRRACDLSTDDPFDSEHGQEFFRFIKEGEMKILKH